jgi:short-subunit dehydrogenase
MKKPDFKHKYGPWALVVGSAEGMGACYAERFAEQGINIIAVDRREELLQKQAEEIEVHYEVEVTGLVCDLGNPEDVSAMLEQVDGLEVGLVVFNAAMSVSGPWHSVNLASKLTMLNVNCVATTMILDRLSRPMSERGRGGIILMTSMAAMQGAPGQACYAACKSYDLILGESLWDELGEDGVDVLNVIVPMVRTPSFEREANGLKDNPFIPIIAPADVVDEAISALGREPSVVAGRIWKGIHFAMQNWLPRKSVIQMMGKQMKSHFSGS